MSEHGPIADAAQAALEEERARKAAEEQAHRDALVARAKARIAEVLENKVDPATLTTQAWADRDVVTATDGATTLVVDAEEAVRLGAVVDGQPTGLSEAVETLAELGRALEKRGR